MLVSSKHATLLIADFRITAVNMWAWGVAFINVQPKDITKRALGLARTGKYTGCPNYSGGPVTACKNFQGSPELLSKLFRVL